jgi:hypothetical protein
VIVVDVSSTISIAITVVASPIVATRDLALGAIGAAIVSGVAHLAKDVFRRFAKEASLQTLNLLMVEQTVELSLLLKSLKKLRDRFDGCTLQRFSAENELLMVAFVVRHIVPLKSERIRRLRNFASGEDLGNVKHLLKLLRVQARGGNELLYQAIIAARLHINILQVAGLVVIEHFFDEKADSAIEILFRLAVAGESSSRGSG